MLDEKEALENIFQKGMETAYCLSLALLLVAAPLVTSTHEEADTYDSYSDSAEGDGEEVEGVVLPSASRPGPTEVRDILDDNYHMFRRKRAAAGHPVEDDEQGNSVPVFHNIEKKKGLQHQRSKDDLRILYLLKTI